MSGEIRKGVIAQRNLKRWTSLQRCHMGPRHVFTVVSGFSFLADDRDARLHLCTCAHRPRAPGTRSLRGARGRVTHACAHVRPPATPLPLLPPFLRPPSRSGFFPWTTERYPGISREELFSPANITGAEKKDAVSGGTSRSRPSCAATAPR